MPGCWAEDLALSLQWAPTPVQAKNGGLDTGRFRWAEDPAPPLQQAPMLSKPRMVARMLVSSEVAFLLSHFLDWQL